MSNPCEKLSEVEGTLRPTREEKDRVKLLPATQEIAPARRQLSRVTNARHHEVIIIVRQSRACLSTRPAFDPNCNGLTGAGCSVPAQGMQFYPYLYNRR
jgi:hypothetical protein